MFQPPSPPKWLEEVSDHLLSSTNLVNNFNQEENSTGHCPVDSFIHSIHSHFFETLPFRLWRMLQHSILVSSVLSIGNPIVVPTLWTFANKWTISENRSRSWSQQRNSATRSLPSLFVKALHFYHPYILIILKDFSIATKDGKDGYGTRTLPSKLVASTLLRSLFKPWWLSLPARFDPSTKQLRMSCPFRQR